MEKEVRQRCERCGEFLHPDRITWLEYDQRTSTYTDEEVPEKYSQGGFPFGARCAIQEKKRHAALDPKRGGRNENPSR
jgi:hypothetical protein